MQWNSPTWSNSTEELCPKLAFGLNEISGTQCLTWNSGVEETWVWRSSPLSFLLCSIWTFLAKWNFFYKSQIFRNLTSLEETSFHIAVLSETGSPKLCLQGADLRCEGVLNPEHFLNVKCTLSKTEKDLMPGRVLHRLRHGRSSPFIKNVRKRILLHSSGNNKPLLNHRSYYKKKKIFFSSIGPLFILAMGRPLKHQWKLK